MEEEEEEEEEEEKEEEEKEEEEEKRPLRFPLHLIKARIIKVRKETLSSPPRPSQSKHKKNIWEKGAGDYKKEYSNF